MNIYQTSFEIHPQSGEYNLKIHFLNKIKQIVSWKQFTFTQKSFHSTQEETLEDLFTKNGFCNPEKTLEGFFTQKDVKEINNIQKHCTSSHPKIMVLDIKNKKGSYLDEKNIIEKCETEICDFFQNAEASCASKSAKKIHSLLKKQGISFIILEGSLKKNLLKNGGFSTTEVNYLNSNEGIIDFCQIAEFFMNGFKFGQSVSVNNVEFSAHNYIKSISQKTKSFQACKNSIVYYPSLYKDIYALGGKFSQSLAPLFSITGDFFENTQITKLNYGVKQ